MIAAASLAALRRRLFGALLEGPLLGAGAPGFTGLLLHSRVV
jgi:hypothetical protein